MALGTTMYHHHLKQEKKIGIGYYSRNHGHCLEMLLQIWSETVKGCLFLLAVLYQMSILKGYLLFILNRVKTRLSSSQ